MPEEYNSMRQSNLFSIEVPKTDRQEMERAFQPLSALWMDSHEASFSEALHQDLAYMLTQVLVAKSDGAWLYSKEERDRPFNPDPMLNNFKRRGLEGENVPLIEDAKHSLRGLLVELSEVAVFNLESSIVYLLPDVSRDSPLYDITTKWLSELPATLPSATVRSAPLSRYEALSMPEQPEHIQWCQALVSEHSATDALYLLQECRMPALDAQIDRASLGQMIRQNLRLSVCASRMAEFYTQKESRIGLRTPQARAQLQSEIHSLIWDCEQNSASIKVADSYSNILRDFPEFSSRYGDEGVSTPPELLRLRRELIRGSDHRARFPLLAGKLGVAPEEVFYGYLHGLFRWKMYAESLATPLSQKAFWNYLDITPLSSLLRTYQDRKGFSLR